MISIICNKTNTNEPRALAHGTSEAQWLLYLLSELRVPHFKPEVLYRDNQSALHIANNLVFHVRTKHIEIDCHLVYCRVQSRMFHLLPIFTHDQVADLLTIYIPACGGVSRHITYVDVNSL